jgi:dihydroorotase-like cyclic amidohydrolase
MSVAQIAVMCRDVNTRVHIAHVSCAAALDELVAAQQAGLPMTGETCPHYLLFTAADMDRLGPYAMIKPPLRTEADQAALWRGLFSGALRAITTDHSPFTVEEKERGMENIWTAAIGSPGVEALVPFVLSEALGGRMSLPWAVRLLCTQPARLFNLYPERGVLQVGAIADLMVYAPTPAGTIDSRGWFSKARHIDKLYHGRPVHGGVRATVVNGAIVYLDGKITADAGAGRFVRPALA